MPASGRGVLQAIDLSFSYHRTGPKVVDGFTHTFPPGSATALVGRSGCGKSTLLYLLALMLRPDAGQIRWDRARVHDLPDGQRAHLRAVDMGFVFQDAILDPALSVLDNVLEAAVFAALPRRTTTRIALDLLDQLGVEVDPGSRPGEISGGQAQRVALCRALVTHPRLIFADEPTGNLDHDSARIVWDRLESQARAGATVILATHDRELARRCDDVLELGA